MAEVVVEVGMVGELILDQAVVRKLDAGYN
jgi:hypothetical protein